MYKRGYFVPSQHNSQHQARDTDIILSSDIQTHPGSATFSMSFWRKTSVDNHRLHLAVILVFFIFNLDYFLNPSLTITLWCFSKAEANYSAQCSPICVCLVVTYLLTFRLCIFGRSISEGILCSHCILSSRIWSQSIQYF